jgi:hypothetical protein
MYIEITTIVPTKTIKTHPARVIDNSILKRKETLHF